MMKMDALNKGIFFMCNRCEDYNKLDINSKINLKSEIASYWNENYVSNFQKHIKPIFQTFGDKIEEFINWEYLSSRGL